MKFSEYANMDAVGLSMAIKKGDLSVMEVTEKAIAGLESMKPS